MTKISHTPELERIPEVKIELPGGDYQELVLEAKVLLEQKVALRKENDKLSEQLYKAMKETAEWRQEAERLSEHNLKRSIEFENMKAKLDTSRMFNFKFLEELEGAFDSDEKFASAEICRDYLDAALFCEKYFDRTENRIRQAQEWYDALNPWEQTDKL